MRISRSTGAISGLLIIVLGLWGALIPFIGPYFHYSFGSNLAWHYSHERLLLNILPGAIAVLGGMLLTWAGSRVHGSIGAWLAMIAGTWFVIGLPVSLLWHHAGDPIGAPMYGHARQMAELVGYFYGLGAVILGLSAFALGRFVSRPSRFAEPVADAPLPTTVEPATVVPADSTAPVRDREPALR